MNREEIEDARQNRVRGSVHSKSVWSGCSVTPGNTFAMLLPVEQCWQVVRSQRGAADAAASKLISVASMLLLVDLGRRACFRACCVNTITSKNS